MYIAPRGGQKVGAGREGGREGAREGDMVVLEGRREGGMVQERGRDIFMDLYLQQTEVRKGGTVGE